MCSEVTITAEIDLTLSMAVDAVDIARLESNFCC